MKPPNIFPTQIALKPDRPDRGGWRAALLWPVALVLVGLFNACDSLYLLWSSRDRGPRRRSRGRPIAAPPHRVATDGASGTGVGSRSVTPLVRRGPPARDI